MALLDPANPRPAGAHPVPFETSDIVRAVVYTFEAQIAEVGGKGGCLAAMQHLATPLPDRE